MLLLVVANKGLRTKLVMLTGYSQLCCARGESIYHEAGHTHGRRAAACARMLADMPDAALRKTSLRRLLHHAALSAWSVLAALLKSLKLSLTGVMLSGQAQLCCARGQRPCCRAGLTEGRSDPACAREPAHHPGHSAAGLLHWGATGPCWAPRMERACSSAGRAPVWSDWKCRKMGPLRGRAASTEWLHPGVVTT